MVATLALLCAPAAATAAAGDVYVADQNAGPAGSGAIFRIEIATGATSVVSQGPPLADPTDMVFDTAGNLVVADEGAEAIYRVDPATGAAVAVAQGGQLADPWGSRSGPAGASSSPTSDAGPLRR